MRVMPSPRWLESSCDNEDIPPWHKEVTPIKRCKRGILKFQKSLIFILGGYIWNVIFSIIFQFWMSIYKKERAQERYMHRECVCVEMLWSKIRICAMVSIKIILFLCSVLAQPRKIWCSPVADKVGTASHSTFHLHVPRPPCGSPLSHTNTTAKKI